MGVTKDPEASNCFCVRAILLFVSYDFHGSFEGFYVIGLLAGRLEAYAGDGCEGVANEIPTACPACRDSFVRRFLYAYDRQFTLEMRAFDGCSFVLRR